MTKLTRAQRDTIIEILANGGELPLDYKHVLFPPERQEYELVYADKDREEDVIAETMAVPLQPIRSFGQNGDGWHNMLIFGDNLQAMKTLTNFKQDGKLVNSDGTGGVRLIYIDPPFATKQDFSRSVDSITAYSDKIVGAKFIEFLRKRFVMMRELLSEDGFIVVHIDYRYGHYIKIILDEVFNGNFRNDIKVPRGTKNVQSQFKKISSLSTGDDSLLLYAKNNYSKFNLLRVDLEKPASGKWDTFWRGTDRPTMRYEIFGNKPDTGQWRWKKARAYEAKNNYAIYLEKHSKKESLDEYYLRNLDDGQDLDFVRLSSDNVVQYYVPPRDSRLANTVWTDVRTLGKVTSYPTEKHEELLFRVIEWLTKPGDLVLDAFAGSGTTCASAEKLNRRWIGIDCGKLAIYTIQKRMLNLCSDVGNKGESLNPSAFTLYNAGLYDFLSLKNLKWESWRFFALNLFQCKDKPHKLKGIQLDGFRRGDDVLVFNHTISGGVVLDYGFIDDLHSQIGTRLSSRFFIIAPAASVAFLEDYIDKGKTRYYILRIPYSIINELHTKDFEAITQPVDELQVNETVESVGFDFIRQPKVVCDYKIKKTRGKGGNIAAIKIKTFNSVAMAKGVAQKKNRETLSLVLVDYDYPHNPKRKGNSPAPPFEFDVVFYAKDIEAKKWEIQIPAEMIKDYAMIVYVDIYGNEYTEIKNINDFKANAKKRAATPKRKSK